MKYDLTRLNSNIDKYIDINFTYDYSKEELKGTELLHCNIDVNGNISKDSLGNIVLNIKVNGKMVLPCAITLKPTNYLFKTEINGTLDELFEKNEEKFTNTLDIFPIIWENILMEVPMRVVSPDADTNLSGDGWKLITEEENPSPLAELGELLEDREVR